MELDSIDLEQENDQSNSSSDTLIRDNLISQHSSSDSIFPPTPSSPTLSHLNSISSSSNSFQSAQSSHTIKMSDPTPSPASRGDSSNNFTMNAYASVTKLESCTFNDWKLRLTTVLGAHWLSKYILRDVETPTDPTARDDHDTNCMRALAAVHATVDAENFEVIRSCSNPREAFLKLCKHHDDAGGLSTAHLFSDLVTLRMSSDGDLKEHIHQFRKIHNDLLSNLSSTPDIKISEPFVTIILINSLPSTFNPLVQSLLTSFESFTLSRLYSLLNIEATRNSGALKAKTALTTNCSVRKSKKKDNKGYPTNPSNKDHLSCLLRHIGHTDWNCKTKK